MSGTIVLILRLLLALALYSFLGWAIYTMWRQVSQATDSVTRVVPRLSVTFRARGEATSHKSFNKEEVTIGRDPACDIHLSEETASVLHARLKYHHRQWWIEDLNSMNGTRLNKHEVSTPTVLTSGDEIVCGKTKLLVDIFVDEIGLPTRKIRG